MLTWLVCLAFVAVIVIVSGCNCHYYNYHCCSFCLGSNACLSIVIVQFGMFAWCCWVMGHGPLLGGGTKIFNNSHGSASKDERKTAIKGKGKWKSWTPQGLLRATSHGSV